MNRYKYTEQQLRDAIKNSLSIRQTLLKLGMSETGGAYYTIKNRINKLNIDISHFTGQLWSKGKTIGPKRPLSDYLSNTHKIQSYKLKLRLIKEGVFKWQCQSCNKAKWLKRLIPLELHHKDGNKDNNSLSNLELLCPNCHAFTDNYRGKNKC